MSPLPSIAVIGQGIAGLACAYRFVKAGFDVTIIGPENRPGSASYAAVGVSTLKGQTEPRTPLFSAKLFGHHNLKEWILEIERDSNSPIAHNFMGVLEPFQNFHDYASISSRVFKEQFRGFLDYRLLGRQQLGLLGLNVQSLSKSVWGAYYYPDGFSFSPPALISALKTFLAKCGVSFVDEALLAIDPNSNEGFTLRTLSQDFIFKEVILAAGCFSKSILKSSRFFDLKINSSFGHTRVYHSSEAVNMAVVRGAYSSCVHKGEFRIGSSTFRNSGSFDRIIHEDKIAVSFGEILGKTCIKPFSTSQVICGERAQTVDRLPLIGTISLASKQLGIATGFDKSGFQLADIAAKFHVSRVIQQPHKLPDWIREFSCDRLV